ncbi:hypothetical protein ABZ547_13330 [Streptomyces sparsogenes]|uniref:hypothetical protein n=1 Tax=Streptomyces sparsogenes TaxID=67365 RepID=UPI0033F1EC88
MSVMESPADGFGAPGPKPVHATGPVGGSAAVVVVRSALGPYLALITECPAGNPLADGHLRVNLGGAADATTLTCADVLYGSVGDPRHAARVLRRYPGCLLATVRDPDGGGRCVALARGAGAPVAVTAAGGPPLSGREHALIASVLYAWVEAGLPLSALAAAEWTFPWPGREPADEAPGAQGARWAGVVLSPSSPLSPLPLLPPLVAKAIW